MQQGAAGRGKPVLVHAEHVHKYEAELRREGVAKGAADRDIGLQDDLHIPDDILLPQDILVCLCLLNDVVPGVVGRLHQTGLCMCTKGCQ